MTIYLTSEQVLQTYEETIAVSGGGISGFIANGKEQIEGTLIHIQNDEYYPNIEDKISYLFYSMCENHCFIDGNKRIALTVSLQMLLFNGYIHVSHSFLRQMENITLGVASSKINYDLLKEIMAAIIYEEYETNEELKLKIIAALE